MVSSSLYVWRCKGMTPEGRQPTRCVFARMWEGDARFSESNREKTRFEPDA